jgi:hypothetical protein
LPSEKKRKEKKKRERENTKEATWNGGKHQRSESVFYFILRGFLSSSTMASKL